MIHLRRGDERGSATVFVVGLAITLVALAGLVADGGGALNARQRLADDVEHAAIAAAQQTDEEAARAEGVIRVDAQAAEAAARASLAGRGYTGIDIDVMDTAVRVHAKLDVATKTLVLVGVNSFHLEATAVAEAGTL
jgi:Flp pilus assembly protein TadG